MRGAALLVVCLLALSGCGYHVAGHVNTLPAALHSIAVPAFSNGTIRYRLTDRMAAAITRELLTRTRYAVVPEPGQADAVLKGSVIAYNPYPISFDPATGRASAIQVNVRLSLVLAERGGKVLFERRNFEVRDRYELATDPRAYFDESDAAIDRLSRDVARSVVTAILENF